MKKNSIARHMDDYCVAQEVRIERQLHKGAFLLLEGDTDIKRFRPFVDETRCSFVNCYGRDNAVGAIKRLYDEGFLGALALADADFYRVFDQLEKHEGIIFSETHDFDLDFATTEVVGRYLMQVADLEKCSEYGAVSEIIKKVLFCLYLVSVARLLNWRGDIRIKLSHMNVDAFISNFTLDFEAYAQEVHRNEPNSHSTKHEFIALVKRAARSSFDLHQITNGHDFHAALGACLRDALGERRRYHTWGSEVGMHLRLALSKEAFSAHSVCRNIRSWERENSPYRILQESVV